MDALIQREGDPRHPAAAIDRATSSDGFARHEAGSGLVQVVLTDEAPVVLSGYEMRLGRDADIAVVGAATHVDEAVELCASLRPHVIIADHDLPGGGALVLLQKIEACSPATHMVLSSTRADGDSVRQAFRRGVSAYVLKSDDLNNLSAIVRSSNEGTTYLSPGVSQVVLEDLLSSEGRERGNALTGRQSEILGLIAKGKTSPEIAAYLGISLRTVHTHRARLMKRLGVHTATELVYKAQQEGLV